ncbi:MAG: DUF3300 domain-containing protein, partial [Proteobacteria bacterium]|nr:DUF3300 domain-containing protein [Pseudomonadota bacterium]
MSILGALTVSTAAHVPLSMAQDYNDPPAAIAQDERLSPRELDSLLAPIALYPDQLLAPLLMAATYPHDVEAAAQWASRPINASLRGDGIAFAIEPFPWDPSVKTLAQFPDVLRMLNEEWDWMVRVGNAFYLQESDVMDSVQRLRHQAFAMGTLRSTDLQRVRFEGGAVIIDMIDPGSVYIPAYDPVRVYGYWSYPDFPPYYFRRPVTVTRYMVVPTLWGWSSWEWHNHRIRVDRPRYSYFHRSNPWRFNDNTWRHNPRPGRDANFRRDDRRDDWRGNDRRDNDWSRGDRNDGPRRDGRRDDQRADVAPAAPVAPTPPSNGFRNDPGERQRQFEQNRWNELRERRNDGDRPRFNGSGEGRQFQPRERQAYAGPQLTPPAPVAPMAPMPPQATREDRGRGFRGGQD